VLTGAFSEITCDAKKFPLQKTKKTKQYLQQKEKLQHTYATIINSILHISTHVWIKYIQTQPKFYKKKCKSIV